VALAVFALVAAGLTMRVRAGVRRRLAPIDVRIQ
jgi:hypothetical protein